MAMDWPFPVCRNLTRSDPMPRLRDFACRAANAALGLALDSRSDPNPIRGRAFSH